MAATTITEYTNIPCTRCSGSGRIACFQHKNGGECFRCGATGIDPQMKADERDMTDSEVVSSLASFGFDVQEFDEKPEGEFGLFLSESQVARRDAAMLGARMLLALLQFNNNQTGPTGPSNQGESNGST